MIAPTPLADIFPRFTEADWRAAVKRANRGGESVAESPALFPRDAAASVIGRQRHGQPWVVSARIDASSANDAIAVAREELRGGAAAIEIATTQSTHPLGGRLAPASVPEVLRALPEGMMVRIDVDDVGLADIAVARQLEVVVAIDPVARIATGSALSSDVDRMAQLAGRGVAAAAIADGRPWHAGGASDEQELGIVLATFIHHLRSIGEKIDVVLVADTDQFRTIAKFRALRLLLARVGEVAKIDLAVRIHAETAWRTMSLREPEMNILRATSAVFGAAAGGADSITVLPFDALTGGGAHGRRLARNTQVILAEEAHMFRVADPAAGSGAIEAMTRTLAEAAWARFRSIEAGGGIVRAIQNGGLIREVAGGERLVFRRLAEAHET